MTYVITTKKAARTRGSLKAGSLVRGMLYRAFDGSGAMRGYAVWTHAGVVSVGAADDDSQSLTPFEVIENPAWTYEEATGVIITIEA